MMYYPKYYHISSGVGISDYELVAFDNALLNAGISNYNLIRVSSILPSNCEQRSAVGLKQGSPLLTAYATIASNIPGQILSTAVGIGIPEDKTKIGLIMEHSDRVGKSESEEIVQAMIIESMANHGIKLQDIIVSSIECTVPDKGFAALISAVTMWDD